MIDPITIKPVMKIVDDTAENSKVSTDSMDDSDFVQIANNPKKIRVQLQQETEEGSAEDTGTSHAGQANESKPSPKERIQAMIDPANNDQIIGSPVMNPSGMVYADGRNAVEQPYINPTEANSPKRAVRSRNCYTYQRDHQGFLCLRNEDGLLERICNFDVIPIMKIIEDNDYDQKIYFVFQISIENCLTINSDKIPICDLKKLDWIFEQSEYKAYLYPDFRNANKHIFVHIAQQLRNVPTQTVYSHTGWRNIGGYNVYLHKGGAIGDIPWNIACSSDKEIEWSDKIDPKDAFYTTFNMINISQNCNKTALLFMFAHLGVLTTLFNLAGYPVRFLLWVYGITQTMKTTTLKLFFNLFNRHHDKTSASFLDTITSIECKASEFKDGVFFLDDYFPPEERRSQDRMMTVLEQAIRIFGDGVSKSRRTSTLEAQKEFEPNGVCAISGEDIAGQLSTLGRCFSLEIEQSDFIPEKISFYQNNPSYYTTHFYHFITWVAKNFNGIVAEIKQKYPLIREEFRSSSRHKRSIDAMTALLIAGDILIRYGVEITCFKPEVHSDMMKEFKNIIQMAGDKHAELMELQKPELMYLAAIDSLIASGRLVALDRNKKIKVMPRNVVGFQDNERLYLYSHTAYNEVIGFYKTQNKIYATEMRTVHKQLDALNLLETDKNSRSKKVSIPALDDIGHVDSRPRMLSIDKHMMNEILDRIS